MVPERIASTDIHMQWQSFAKSFLLLTPSQRMPVTLFDAKSYGTLWPYPDFNRLWLLNSTLSGLGSLPWLEAPAVTGICFSRQQCLCLTPRHSDAVAVESHQALAFSYKPCPLPTLTQVAVMCIPKEQTMEWGTVPQLSRCLS